MSRVGPVVVSAFVLLSFVGPLPAAEPDLAARPLPTPRQWKILAALDQPSELHFSEQPLADAMNYLKTRHDIEVQLDGKALEENGTSADTPITLDVKEIRLRSLLRLILTNLDLTYVVGDGYLFLTSKTEVENKLSCKVYPVHDLVTLDSEFRPPLKLSEPAEADFQSLIDMIVGTVVPTTWDEVGGPGAIEAFLQSQSIAVSQTDEGHEDLVLLLTALRRIRDDQIAAAKSMEALKPQHRTATEEPLSAKVYRLSRPRDRDHDSAQPADTDKEAIETKQSDQSAPAKAGKGGPEINAPDGKLDTWAVAIATLVPQIIEPDSWQPVGKGVIAAVGETVVVQQTDAIHYRVGMLINDVLPGSVPPAMLAYYPAVRLSMPPAAVRWPVAAQPFLPPAEARIIELLAAPAEIDVAELPLCDVMHKLSDQHHVQIYLDEKSLEESGCSRDTPITRSIKGVSLRTQLKLLLDELDLTYVVRNEVLMITSKTECECMLTLKIYPVFDLVVRPPGAPTSRPGLDFRPLIENIKSTVAPTTWDEVGGPGEIKPFTNSAALVISQTTAAHDEITELLKALREARTSQGEVVNSRSGEK